MVSEGLEMRVLFVTAEAQPLAKSGGLADVSRALPIALRQRGIDVRILLPGYPSAIRQLENPRIEASLSALPGAESAALISGLLPGSDVPVWLVHAPSLFSRAGGLYQDEAGHDWPDNAQRFAFLSRVAAEIAAGRLLSWRPDIVHANDWHAGLVPLLLSTEAGFRPATVFTIHNLAFQGNFPRDVLPAIGLPEQLFTADGVEFYGQVSYLKTALRYSDKITTVSPTYAAEILSPAFGCGLDGILRNRELDFTGILNGIDMDLWDPAMDRYLPQPYSARDISGKRICKAELQRECGLETGFDTPLIGFVSRLAHQKMADVIRDVVPSIVESGGQFVLVAEGDSALETAFEELGRRYPSKVAIHIGYEEGLAHRLLAGADILLAPARFEPCGLTQLYASRYGTIPIVRRTGGLADTVTDATATTLSDRTATGFVFEDENLAGLKEVIDRTLTLYKEPLAWRRLQLQAMARDFSWDTSAAKYAALYQEEADLSYSAPSLPVAATMAMTAAEIGRQAML